MDEKITIAHVSDLHVRGEGYSEELKRSVIEFLNEVMPDVLVITGDITDNGYYFEYEWAKEVIDQMPARHKLVVPGNHDARNAGYLIFEEIFGTRHPVLKVGNIKILGIDSSEPDVDDGHIGRLAYDLVRREFKHEENTIKVIALHHHLIPVPGTGRERNIPVDCGDFLRVICEVGVNIALCGHKHVPWIWRLNDMLILNAGTAMTMRVKARTAPSFNLIEVFSDRRVRITRVDVRTRKSEVIYEGRLASVSL